MILPISNKHTPNSEKLEQFQVSQTNISIPSKPKTDHSDPKTDDSDSELENDELAEIFKQTDDNDEACVLSEALSERLTKTLNNTNLCCKQLS